MANIRLIKQPSSSCFIYEINGKEIIIKWSKDVTSVTPSVKTFNGFNKFVNDIEKSLKNKDIIMFKSLIWGPTYSNLIKISEEVFHEEFELFLKEACIELFQNDSIVCYMSLCKYIFNSDHRFPKNENNIIFNTVSYYQKYLKNNLRNALSNFRINSVIKIYHSFPHPERINFFLGDLEELSKEYFLRLGKMYIEKHKKFNKAKFINFALGLKQTNFNNKEDKAFFHSIFDELDFYLIELLKNYRYSMSDDEWLIVDMNIDIPNWRVLDWTHFNGIVKNEAKQYLNYFVELGETESNIFRRYTNLIRLGPILSDIGFKSTDSILNMTTLQVEQIIEIFQQRKNKNGDFKFSIKTIQGTISECRMFFDWVVDNKNCHIFGNPFREIIMHNVNSFVDSTSYIPEEVIEQIQNKLDELSTFVQASWLIMMNTGMRINEVLNLECDCISYEEKDNLYYIKFIPYKTLKYRRKKGLDDYHILPLEDETVVSLIKTQVISTEPLREINGENRIFLKSTKQGIRLFTTGEVSNEINGLIKNHHICAQDGTLWKYTNHQCRKTVAVSMFTNGATVAEVSDWLSHLDEKATMRHYHDVEQKKIAELDFEYFEEAFGNLDSEIKDGYSITEFKGLKNEILLGARSTPEGHGVCVKHVSFGPCMKKKCVGCKMLITGPQKLSMWKKLYEEQRLYLSDWISIMESKGVTDWKDYREYHAEMNLLETYEDTILKLEKFIKERLPEDEQKRYSND